MQLISPSLFFLLVLTISPLYGQQHQPSSIPRDTQSIDILRRVVQTAGGLQALTAVHNLTETGEIKFHWNDDVKAPLTIHMLPSSQFKMEADLPSEKKIWLVRNGIGTKSEKSRKVPMTDDAAINLQNLTYPIAHIVAALSDITTGISFVDVEIREGHSQYRLRVTGRLGLTNNDKRSPVVKDLIIDALTFDLVGVEDRPFSARSYRPQDASTRSIEYGDFKTVQGIRVPFAITTKLMGQKTLSINLTDAVFGSTLTDADSTN
jgi:hypothetical protein